MTEIIGNPRTITSKEQKKVGNLAIARHQLGDRLSLDPRLERVSKFIVNSKIRQLQTRKLILALAKYNPTELSERMQNASTLRPRTLKFSFAGLELCEYGENDFTVEAIPRDDTSTVLTEDGNSLLESIGLPRIECAAPTKLVVAKAETELQAEQILDTVQDSGIQSVLYGPLKVYDFRR